MNHLFFEGKTLLVIVDDYSCWVEVFLNKTTDSESVIASLKTFGAPFGLPHTIVTDNATAFTSEKFKTFCKVNAIEHVTSPPYHSQSNGLAERVVGIVKSSLKKIRFEGKKGSIEEQIKLFLFKCHTSPLSDCNKSPASGSYIQLQSKNPTFPFIETKSRKDELEAVRTIERFRRNRRILFQEEPKPELQLEATQSDMEFD